MDLNFIPVPMFKRWLDNEYNRATNFSSNTSTILARQKINGIYNELTTLNKDVLSFAEAEKLYSKLFLPMSSFNYRIKRLHIINDILLHKPLFNIEELEEKSISLLEVIRDSVNGEWK